MKHSNFQKLCQNHWTLMPNQSNGLVEFCWLWLVQGWNVRGCKNVKNNVVECIVRGCNVQERNIHGRIVTVPGFVTCTFFLTVYSYRFITVPFSTAVPLCNIPFCNEPLCISTLLVYPVSDMSLQYYPPTYLVSYQLTYFPHIQPLRQVQSTSLILSLLSRYPANFT